MLSGEGVNSSQHAAPTLQQIDEEVQTDDLELQVDELFHQIERIQREIKIRNGTYQDQSSLLDSVKLSGVSKLESQAHVMQLDEMKDKLQLKYDMDMEKIMYANEQLELLEEEKRQMQKKIRQLKQD